MIDSIHEIIIASVSGGFFLFCGYWILIALIMGVPAKILMIAINRPLRHWNIRKHGYPPAHCDADGDFKSEND